MEMGIMLTWGKFMLVLLQVELLLRHGLTHPRQILMAHLKLFLLTILAVLILRTDFWLYLMTEEPVILQTVSISLLTLLADGRFMEHRLVIYSLQPLHGTTS